MEEMWGEGNQATVAECEGKGCGEGDRANTPHISQLKTKPALACCSVNACPAAARRGSSPPRPHTQQHPRAGHRLWLGPEVHNSARPTLRGAHTLAHTHTHTHTPKHFEPVNTTVIQRQWGVRG